MNNCMIWPTGRSAPADKPEWLERHEENCLCSCHTNRRLRTAEGAIAHTTECEEFLSEGEA
jgi:hypothetical protein